jgi:hypothetical protein
MATVTAYDQPALNELYNLLFADDPAAFADLIGEQDPATLAADDEAESRLRVAAFRLLKAAGAPPPIQPPLLGVIVEVALEAGLDTLAAYADDRLRYINHGGGVSIVEAGSPLAAQVEAVMLAAAPVVAAIGPWQGDRQPPPPTGQARLTFLVGAELYFGQGPAAALAGDALAGPVLRTATTLLAVLANLAPAGQAAAPTGGR